MKVLLTLALLLSTVALAQIEDFHIVRLADADELSEFTRQATTEADEADQSGLSFASSSRVEDVATPEEDLEENGFRIGDYTVLCFEPVQTMYIRILDTTPTGTTHQLYPAEGSVQVEGGQMYCIGDENSDVQFRADEASGIGEGILWIFGSETNMSQDVVDDWKVPSAMSAMSRHGFERVPTKGTATVDQPDESEIYEAWLRYEVKR